jgi:predicted Zn-dependent protease
MPLAPPALARALALALALGGLPTCATAQALPDLGSVGDVVMSPQMERRLGESIVRDIRFRDPDYLDDPELVDYLSSLGMRLVRANPAARQDFEFFAMRDSVVNAFALPGGFVGVNTGLLTLVDSESELASVLAHEIAHVSQRHMARMLGQEQQMQMPVLAALAAAILLGHAHPDLTAGALTAAQAGAAQTQLSYSRDFEREADRIGLRTLEAAGFDPRAMATVFEKLQRATRLSEDATLPGWLRTHPMTVERIADAQNRAANMPYRQHVDTLDFQLVRAKLRAELGEPASAVSYFRAALREQRYASESAARYGLADALLRERKSAEAGAEVAKLRAAGVASAMVDLLDARAKQAAGQRRAADALLAKAVERYPDSRALAYARVAGLQAEARNDAALEALREALRAHPDDAHLYTLQAQTYAALGKRLLQHQAQGEAYALQGSLPAAIEQLQIARSAGDGDFYQLSMIDARLKELRARHAEELKEQQKR